MALVFVPYVVAASSCASKTEAGTGDECCGGGEGGEAPAGGSSGGGASAGGKPGEGGTTTRPSGGSSWMHGSGGAQSAPGGAAGAAGEAAFLPVDGLRPDGVGRPIESGFRVHARGLVANSAGESFLLWDGFETPESNSRSVHLDHFDAQGESTEWSALAKLDPDGLVLHPNGAITVWKNHCDDASTICFARGSSRDAVESSEWPFQVRSLTTYQLSEAGNIADRWESESSRRTLLEATKTGSNHGLYTLSHETGYVLRHLDDDANSAWSVELLPHVVPPAGDPNAPLDELLALGALASQSVTKPVVHGDRVVVGAVVTRGTLAALEESAGADLPLPDDPRCGDVLFVSVRTDGRDLRYDSTRTPVCETLPKLAVSEGYAVVASVVAVAHEGGANDTEQYDIGISILDLGSGATSSRTIGIQEDDWVDAVERCGKGFVCLAGMTGARSVDTGSIVSYGEGFIQRMAITGNLDERWTLTSPRHTRMTHLAAGSNGSLLFFATTNGPITHTADQDPSLDYNEGILGKIEP